MSNKHKHQESMRLKKNIIVAVRMPKGLIDELKDIQKINHFMDISDEIRFIIRRYCLNQHQDATLVTELKRKEKLVEQLSKIIEEMKNAPQ